MLKIGQVYKSRKYEIIASATILDLSEDLEWVMFKCSLCKLTHKILKEKFNELFIPKEKS